MGITWEEAEVAAQNRPESHALGCGLNRGQGQEVDQLNNVFRQQNRSRIYK